MEWAVQPPGNWRAAIPVDATASAVIRSARKRKAMTFSAKIFPVPAGASIMKGCARPF